MDIVIPSPSVFLGPEVPISAPPIQPAKRAQSHTVAATPRPQTTPGVLGGGISKPKQTKSRNGCSTCKNKRLKCDEAKPTCGNCNRRQVPCGGYNKNFKWKTFEEPATNIKPASKTKRGESSPPAGNHRQASSRPSMRARTLGDPSPDSASAEVYDAHPFSPDGFNALNPCQTQGEPALHALHGLAEPQLISQSQSMSRYQYQHHNDMMHVGMYAPGTFELETMASLPSSSMLDSESSRTSSSTFSSGSPQMDMSNLVEPGTDLSQAPDPAELRPPPSPRPYQPGPATPTPHDVFCDPSQDEEVDEEIVRDPWHDNTSHLQTFSNSWSMRLLASESPSSESSSSSDITIYAQPQLSIASPEMLVLRYDRETCGILSVKDGQRENPWRELIWPLAQTTPALYHAISSMTAFHGSRLHPELRVHGMEHLRNSVSELVSGLAHMRLDAALATTLVLAFSESWDRHVSTGIQHLRGARLFMNQAMQKRQAIAYGSPSESEEGSGLRFLCNTFIYMDVLARLTSVDEDDSGEFRSNLAIMSESVENFNEVDPLLGCATTLFPLIGHIASLASRVRSSESNSIGLVSQASELQSMLQQWEVPSPQMFETPIDETCEVRHAVQTAEAYRWATLLYLHQAVPELPSEPAIELAKRILKLLATVPLSSRTTIVHIFPLFAASCEALSYDDREWVAERWKAMMARMNIGNVDSCWEVVREVWNRRDKFELEKVEHLQKRMNARGVPAGHLVSLNIGTGKRKAMSAEELDTDTFFGNYASMDHSRGAPISKKRALTNPIGMQASPSRMSSIDTSIFMQPGAMRKRSTDVVPSLESLDPEYTVRGRLHWLSVMKDWNWEVLLG